jgi:tellurite resistance protein TehA-like permease
MNSETTNNSKRPSNIRSVFDWVMGVIYLGVGFVLTFALWLGIRINFPPADVAQIFGTACMVYGGFRIYRGFKTRHAE